jgi:hypothetical protein
MHCSSRNHSRKRKEKRRTSTNKLPYPHSERRDNYQNHYYLNIAEPDEGEQEEEEEEEDKKDPVYIFRTLMVEDSFFGI